MILTLSQKKALEEIHLLNCSLLPEERLEFTEEAALWKGLLDSYALDPECDWGTLEAQALPDSDSRGILQGPAHFEVGLKVSADVWFDVLAGIGKLPQVSVRGDRLGRAEQARWQEIVAEAEAASADNEYPLYEMMSTHLLPELHACFDQPTNTSAEAEGAATPTHSRDPSSHGTGRQTTSPTSPRFHALFISHHLKSPQKRRSLSQWSHELTLAGFAKIGYPGVIYCEGAQEDVEDFIDRVRSMQWQALRLRFFERSPGAQCYSDHGDRCRRWFEFEKVGQVVQEMQRLGREQFVVEMGIGSAGNGPTGK